MIEEQLPETRRKVLCPNCNHRTLYGNWETHKGEVLHCSYCRLRFRYNPEAKT